MANCRYCSRYMPDGQDASVRRGMRWEPLAWICDKGWAVVDGEHGCADYMREVGSDDDFTADLNEPLPDP